ncbi:uncharacterized protein BP5553_07729 [Venustampulla echinocandica]|uniref:phosphoribosylglycinamide formyltransferase 1 n=1 Tax=Venustampulla echinocandica TaxID=2656787 RepID=A0A370THC5_9HELO|nr:uncharacterized protein BP5553_07729 [Venustampulla echinocandica]RDL34601.1 hypothetical protein BP5553_07729 [Venustampulla echinocandica]
MAHDPPPTKVTVLISGEGSNLQALIDASSSLMPYLRIVRVISNKAGANGLNRAKAASIPTTYHNLVAGKYHKPGEKDPNVIKEARERYDADLASLILKDSPDLVALPGKYDGTRAIERAYDDYHKGKLEHDTTGIMVHYVISEVDRGTPIVVRQVKCKTPETLDELKNRMHQEEHQLIKEGTQMAIHNLWEERAKSG